MELNIRIAEESDFPQILETPDLMKNSLERMTREKAASIVLARLLPFRTSPFGASVDSLCSFSWENCPQVQALPVVTMDCSLARPPYCLCLVGGWRTPPIDIVCFASVDV